MLSETARKTVASLVRIAPSPGLGPADFADESGTSGDDLGLAALGPGDEFGQGRH